MCGALEHRGPPGPTGTAGEAGRRVLGLRPREAFSLRFPVKGLWPPDCHTHTVRSGSGQGDFESKWASLWQRGWLQTAQPRFTRNEQPSGPQRRSARVSEAYLPGNCPPSSWAPTWELPPQLLGPRSVSPGACVLLAHDRQAWRARGHTPAAILVTKPGLGQCTPKCLPGPHRLVPAQVVLASSTSTQHSDCWA